MNPIRLTLLAAFCHVRGREIADALTELLITTVHRIGAKAEKRVEGELITDLKRVAGKPAVLFKLAAASLSKPDGAVRDVVFPAVGEQTLRDLVAEGENTGPVYRRHLQTVIHNSYRSHYRRMLPLVLDALDFRSSNQAHRPVLDALGVIPSVGLPHATQVEPLPTPPATPRARCAATRPRRPCRWTAWCRQPGATRCWKRTPGAAPGSTASPTRSASCRRCASSSDAGVS